MLPVTILQFSGLWISLSSCTKTNLPLTTITSSCNTSGQVTFCKRIMKHFQPFCLKYYLLTSLHFYSCFPAILCCFIPIIWCSSSLLSPLFRSLTSSPHCDPWESEMSGTNSRTLRKTTHWIFSWDQSFKWSLAS